MALGVLAMFLFETDRLALSKLTAEDAPFILELLNDQAFLKYIGDRKVRTLEEARMYILKGPIKSYRKHGFGLYLTTLKKYGTPIGICGLLKRDNLDDADIGFAFLPEFRRQGFGYEAASATLQYGRDQLGLKRIVAITQANNKGSIRLLEKLEMQYQRIITLSENEPELQLYGRDF